MAYMVFDTDGYQNVVDFKTGDDLEAWESPVVDDVQKILATCAYPGDLEAASVEWKAGTAKKLADYMNPDLMILTFATADLIKTYTPMTPQEEASLNARLFASIEDFLKTTGFEPMIISNGGMTDIKGVVNAPELRGKLFYSHASGFPYAGVFAPEVETRKICMGLPHVTAYTKEQIVSDFPEMSPEQLARTADLLLMLDEGYVYSKTGFRNMRRLKASRLSRTLPVHTTLRAPKHITDVRACVDEALDAGRKVALILLEAVAPEEFALPYETAAADEKWMVYDSGLLFYMAAFSGRPFYKNNFPIVLEPRGLRRRTSEYPYSQFLEGLPGDVIGRRPDKKTAAVGTRSMYTHLLSQAGITIECHARNLSPSGVCSVINV